MIGQEISARKIGWLEVGTAIKSELKNLLGKDIDCVASREDYDYWGVRLVGYEMPITEVELLLNMLEADEEMRDESIPLPEDKQATVKSIGMQMCRELLSLQMQCSWEKELLDGRSISLLEISIKN
jgi:hypothetical protein